MGEIELRLKELINDTAAEINVDIIEMEIMPDHVHLLLEVDPQFGIHRAVKAIKGKTSRVLRSEFASLRSRLPSLWTNSYFCIHSRRCALVCDKAVYRKPEECLT